MVHKEVIGQPVVREAVDAEGVPALIADIDVRGGWQPQTMVLIGVRVIDTDALSYEESSVEAVIALTEAEKSRSIWSSGGTSGFIHSLCTVSGWCTGQRSSLFSYTIS